jgi:hypothetical protein
MAFARGYCSYSPAGGAYEMNSYLKDLAELRMGAPPLLLISRR